MEYDAVIVDCGPSGAVTANLLGIKGRKVLLLEKCKNFHGETLSIHMDGEGRLKKNFDENDCIANPVILDHYIYGICKLNTETPHLTNYLKNDF
jgi:flavin-dependent dehydrogenase